MPEQIVTRSLRDAATMLSRGASLVETRMVADEGRVEWIIEPPEGRDEEFQKIIVMLRGHRVGVNVDVMRYEAMRNRLKTAMNELKGVVQDGNRRRS